ncbi:MAG: hypothetical protein R3B48_22005 [Kofleriaceae bacterium]
MLLAVSVPPTKPIIYVSALGGVPEVAGFSLTEGGAAATGGVVFVFAKSETATVTWVLGPGIAELTSQDIQFSSVSGGEQMLTLEPPGKEAEASPFSVVFDSGAAHDPQIVVTPIGGGVPPAPGKGARTPVKKAARAPAKTPAKKAAKTPAKKAVRRR